MQQQVIKKEIGMKVARMEEERIQQELIREKWKLRLHELRQNGFKSLRRADGRAIARNDDLNFRF